jgi:hypothetical protein
MDGGCRRPLSDNRLKNSIVPRGSEKWRPLHDNATSAGLYCRHLHLTVRVKSENILERCNIRLRELTLGNDLEASWLQVYQYRVVHL